MGNNITALAPLKHVTERTYLANPKPAAPMIIQNLIESIEGLIRRFCWPPFGRFSPFLSSSSAVTGNKAGVLQVDGVQEKA